jgi:serine/threonine protein kinase
VARARPPPSHARQLFAADYAHGRGLPVPPYNTFAVDVWAIGVLLHIMLRGHYPFADEKTGSKAAREGKLSAELCALLKSEQPGLSEECLDFVAKCLTPGEAQRPTVAELVAHHWVASAVPTLPRAASQCQQTLAEVEDIIRRIEQRLP